MNDTPGSGPQILYVADIHYSLKQYDWIMELASDYDAVVIAGDLLDLAGHADLDTQMVVVERYLRKLSTKTTVLASSGNHDGDIKTEHDEYIAEWLVRLGGDRLYVDYQSVDVGGIHFTVCPWWDGEYTRARMNDFLAAEAEIPKDRWVWVHHAPPHNEPVSWTGKKHLGDAFLIDLIERFSPGLVLSGHIHNSPFREGGSWIAKVGSTWCMNPGRQIGPRPAYVSLDLGAMAAHWVSDYLDPQEQALA